MSNTINEPALSNRPSLKVQEIQVALGISCGKTCQEIGQAMGLKYETVRSYVKRLRDKTGRRRKPQLAVWATQQHGWLEKELVKLNKTTTRR